MKSFKVRAAKLALLAVFASVCGANPAMADEAKSMAKAAVLLPVRAASVASGLAVGIPVAIVRRASNRCIEFSGSFADNIGGKEHIPPMMMGAVLGMPFGLIVGTGEGCYYGGKNAFSNCVEKPFSKASFSLDTELV